MVNKDLNARSWRFEKQSLGWTKREEKKNQIAENH